MANEQWEKVGEIFNVARRQTPELRQNYLNQACGENKTLLAEVESLLASHDSSDSFLETPAMAEVVETLANNHQKLEQGSFLGNYQIIRQIGTGGMGEVYLAQDSKLDRQVAVKILNQNFSKHESNLKRFVHEAKAASALNHPNILVIHEIGETDQTHYLVSEFIKGQTLREVLQDENLKLSKVLDISIQIANALTAAHEARLAHRDIKPENIMIRPDGFLKVLDFGLAKLIEQKNKSILGLEDSILKENPTADGLILGTINYMSPEQAKGKRVDERTDIFSFGVVIYEMITGQTPFAGDSMSETFANLINAEPQPLANIPSELQRIISKMLRKSKDERYQTMKDVLVDLKDLRENLKFDEKLERSASPVVQPTEVLHATTGDANLTTAQTSGNFSQQITKNKPLAVFALIALLIGLVGLGYYFFSGQTASGGKKSIAVLPLKPLSAENRDAIYELGIADSLIFKLTSAKNLIVRPSSSTLQYVDAKKDVVAIGKEQQVDYILASNYQIADGKIRITSQLINVSSGAVEESFKDEQNITNIFAIQDAFAANIGQNLLTKLSGESNSLMAKRYTNNDEAYRLYLRGKALTAKHNRKDAEKAVEYLEQAVKIDPNYTLGYAQLANAYGAMALFGGDKIENRLKQKAAIEKALSLDENLAEVHARLGVIKLEYDWDFDGAERAFKKALELDRNSPNAHGGYALYLSSMGRHNESIAEARIAIDLDPTSVLSHKNYAQFLYFARRYNEAIIQAERTVQMDPNFRTIYGWLINSHKQRGEDDKAFEWFLRAPHRKEDNPEKIQLWKEIYAKSGWRGITQKQLEDALEEERKGEDRDWILPRLYAELGDSEQAIVRLEKSFKDNQRGWGWTTLKIDPIFDAIRSDPRFQEIVKRVGLK